MKKGYIALAALAIPGLMLSGLTATTAEDHTIELAFGEAQSFGDAARNPADQYLVAGADGAVRMSWTETGDAKRSRNAFLAVLNEDGEAIGGAQRVNDQEGRVHFYGGDNRTKFTIGSDGSVTAVWAATLPEFRTGELRFAHAAKDDVFAPSVRLNDDELPVNHAFATIATSPNGKIYAAQIKIRTAELKSG